MPYSQSGRWIMQQLAREDGGALREFDGGCVAVIDARIVAAGPTPEIVAAQLSDLAAEGVATVLQVRLGPLV